MKTSRMGATLIAAAIALTACGKKTEETPPATSEPTASYSPFGAYQALPEWSGWCGAAEDPEDCAKPLEKAVSDQTPESRSTVRGHGWGLWAGITTPITDSGFDSETYTSTKFGTTGCWSKQQDTTACSGVFPIWMTWPNTGKPFASTTNNSKAGSLLNINRRFASASAAHKSLSRGSGLLMNASAKTAYADPTQIQTVNTTSSQIPVYKLPALVVEKQCGLPAKEATEMTTSVNRSCASTDKNCKDAVKRAWTTLQAACDHKGNTGIICADQKGVCDGSTFVNQGDVMVATESLSEQAWNTVQEKSLYDQNTLNQLYNDKKTGSITSWLTPTFISTKHMFWPVKGCNPNATRGEKGCRVRYGALPPWVPAKFKSTNYATDSAYRGYETWGEVVAIDTCGEKCQGALYATLKLAHVENASAISTHSPKVFPVDAFVHLQVSEETLQNAFTATDRALLDQATIWAYGDESNGFEAGDFLVVAAMHINTKEIDSWAFQSVWWSPMDDTATACPVGDVKSCFGQSDVYDADSQYSGLSEKEKKTLEAKAGNHWKDYYLLTDSYGIRYEINGTPASTAPYFGAESPKWASQRPSGDKVGQLPVSMNVYIEPVIHPIGTNCQNCHRRAGVKTGFPKGDEQYSAGIGLANYQTSQCPSLLADYGSPEKDPCMVMPWVTNTNAWTSEKPANNCVEGASGIRCDGKNAFPIVSTDTTWFIADNHVQKAAE